MHQVLSGWSLERWVTLVSGQWIAHTQHKVIMKSSYKFHDTPSKPWISPNSTFVPFTEILITQTHTRTEIGGREKADSNIRCNQCHPYMEFGTHQLSNKSKAAPKRKMLYKYSQRDADCRKWIFPLTVYASLASISKVLWFPHKPQSSGWCNKLRVEKPLTHA